MKTLLELLNFGPQIAFGGDDSGGGGGGGSSSSDDDDSSSSGGFLSDLQMGLGLKEKDQDFIDRTAATIEKTQGSAAASTYSNQMENKGFEDNYNEPEPEPKKEEKSSLIKADNTIGQVSATGQYAGDGFEWVETETSGGSKLLTRTYTGTGKDNGLGQDVLFGNTADKDLKETIAQISLDEGSAFAASPASATDIPANEIGIPTGFFPESDSYAEQVGQADYTPTMQYGTLDEPAESEKTFGEVFAEERAKQGDGGTFTYDGKEYTTDLAAEEKPEPEPVETGPAFDYTGVSMGELGRGAPEGTLPPGTFEYAGGVDPEMEVLSALKNSSSDPIGEGLMNTGEYLAATKYENEKADASPATGTQVASAGSLSGLTTDFQPLLVDDLQVSFPEADPMAAQEASFDQPSGLGLTDDDMGLPSEPVDFSQFEPEPEKESLKDSIIKVLGAEDAVSKFLGLDQTFVGDAAKNISTGAVKGTGALTTGLGQTYDQLVRQDDDPLTPYDESGLYSAGQKIFDFGDEMSSAFSDMSDRYEGDQEIYKNLKSYDDVVGYGPGQVDRTLLEAAGKKPGDMVQMGPDTGFDASTAAQKTVQGVGSTALPLILSTVNPFLGVGAGQQSVVGELSTELNRFIESDPRIKNTQLYRDALAANEGDEAKAIQAIQQQARGKTQKYAAGLGGGTTAAQLALFSKANPIVAMAGSGATETLQEGIGESFSVNNILNNLMPELNLPIEKKEVLEASVPAAGAGVTVATPTGIQQLVSKGPDVTTEGPAQPGGDQTPGSDQAFVPTSATAGQIATDPVGIQTEYEKAAGVDTTQMRPEIAPDRVTVAEALMDQQLEDQGAIDVADLQDLGLTLFEMEAAAERAITNRMDKDAKMLRALAEDSVVNTGGISAELVEEMNAKLDSAVVARITQEAFNNPLVTKDGETRVDLGIQKAAIESALQRPAEGIEQAMLPPVDVQTSIPAIDRTAPKDNTAKEDSAVARAQEDQAVFDAANEALAESRREASLDQPEIVVAANLDTAPGEAELRLAGAFDSDNPFESNISIGTTVGGLTVADSTGNADLGRGSLNNLDPRSQIGGEFTSLDGQVMDIKAKGNPSGGRTPDYGQPLTRSYTDKNGNTTIQVASRISGGPNQRDDYTSVQVTLPKSVVENSDGGINFDVLEEAEQLALDQWNNNYKGVTSSNQLERNTGELSLSSDLTQPSQALKDLAALADAEAAREASLEQPDSAPTPEVTEEVSGIEQVAETKDTTPKLSPFTEEGREGIAALNTTPSKVNLSPVEEEVAVDTKPPSPFTEEGRAEIEAQKEPSQVNLSPAENVEGTTNIPAVEQTVAQEEQTKDETKPFLPVIEQTILPDDEEETVEVEVDETPDTETEEETTVEIDLPFVAPEVTTDADGNNTFECPDDSYTLVAGPDGPICKKNVQTTRMRAGRSLSPYTRLNIPEGYKGPGQKTKTTTRTETTEPIRA